MPQTNNQNTPSSYSSEWVAGYFDQEGLREWNRLVQTPLDEVSLHIHSHYLKKHVPAGARVLEVGAGPGRFTQVLAELGARVLVADISQRQLDLNKQHAEKYGFAHAVEGWQQVDICDMACFETETFDRVVAYGGPLSYVLDQRDMALSECLRVLNRKGILLLSVMSLLGSAHRFFGGLLKLPVESNLVIVQTGDILPGDFEGARHFMHMFRAAEFRDWLEKTGLILLALSASNCLSTGWDEALKEVRLDESVWNQLLRMELEACAEEGCQDMGTHLIAVAKKR